MNNAKLISQINIKNIPRHIAIIMDGNGRWAKNRKLPKIMGHRAGVKTVRKIIKLCDELGVEVLSLYAFSTENWNRPLNEVDKLMGLLSLTLKNEIRKLNNKNVKFVISGDLEQLKPVLRKLLKKSMVVTETNTGLVLNIALNYGGRQEIIHACREIAEKVKGGKVKPEDIDEGLFAGHLFTAKLPDPDLLIRTSGEFRISNFMLYQIAYSEIYITKVLWPDFDESHLFEAIIDFQKRERRFGSSK